VDDRNPFLDGIKSYREHVNAFLEGVRSYREIMKVWEMK